MRSCFWILDPGFWTCGWIPSNVVTADSFWYVFLTPVWVKLWMWFFQCIAKRYCQVNWWSKFLIQPMHLSVIDQKKCPKSPHTSWGDFGHTYFTPLILLAQSGLFIYITLILEIIIVNWSNLSTIILTLQKKWSFPLRISLILLKKSLTENFIFFVHCKSQ